MVSADLLENQTGRTTGIEANSESDYFAVLLTWSVILSHCVVSTRCIARYFVLYYTFYGLFGCGSGVLSVGCLLNVG